MIWAAVFGMQLEGSPGQVTPGDSALRAVPGAGAGAEGLLPGVDFWEGFLCWSLFHLEAGGKMPCSSQQALMCQPLPAFANTCFPCKIFMLFLDTWTRMPELSEGLLFFSYLRLSS